MPSSSTRSTSLEHQLFMVYRFALARLWDSKLRNYAEYTTGCFAELLDIDRESLFQIVKEQWRPWQELRQENARIALSDRISCAGNAYADAANLLQRAGMVVEAGKFAAWADVLRNTSTEWWRFGNEGEGTEEGG